MISEINIFSVEAITRDCFQNGFSCMWPMIRCGKWMHGEQRAERGRRCKIVSDMGCVYGECTDSKLEAATRGRPLSRVWKHLVEEELGRRGRGVPVRAQTHYESPHTSQHILPCIDQYRQQYRSIVSLSVLQGRLRECLAVRSLTTENSPLMLDNYYLH